MPPDLFQAGSILTTNLAISTTRDRISNTC